MCVWFALTGCGCVACLLWQPWKPTAHTPCFPSTTPKIALGLRMEGLLPPVLTEPPQRRELPPYTHSARSVSSTKKPAPARSPRIGFGRTNPRPGSSGSPALLPGERHGGGMPAGFRGKIHGYQQPQGSGRKHGSRGSSRGSSEFDRIYQDAVQGGSARQQPGSSCQPVAVPPEKLISCAAELVAMGYDENLCRAAALKSGGDTMHALEMVVMGAVTEMDVPPHLR
eukprot:COSAG02_NODE_7511_length_2977_cov_1.102119_1_plen_225_part_10